MDDEIKQDIRQIKTVIHLLYTEINQQFSKLTESIAFSEQLTEQVGSFSIPKNKSQSHEKEVTHKSKDLINSDTPKVLERPNRKQALINQYKIDYSYIDREKYSSWLDNLEAYNKSMAELRTKPNPPYFINFCKEAIKSIESSLKILFEKEYLVLPGDKKFLDAYEKVYSEYINKNWEIPNIYIDIITIKANGYLKINDNKFVSREEINNILNRNNQVAIEIFFTMLNPNFIKNSHLNKNFFLIKGVKQYRNLDSHGSIMSVETGIKKDVKQSYHYLYSPTPKYQEITKVVEWFVQETYKRIGKISEKR